MIKDSAQCAIAVFKNMYEDKKRNYFFDAYDAMPDPQVEWVWLVIAKKETKKEIQLFASIVYIKHDDAEEVSAFEALKKYGYCLDEAHFWVDSDTKKKAVDLTAQ